MLAGIFIISLVVNVLLLSAQFATIAPGPTEYFHSGDVGSKSKIALLRIRGTIMPPFTERILKTIEIIEKDEQVVGILLEIDSPGGFVADSHQIYRRLNQFRERTSKPIYVSMKRMAASGGVYVAMAAGPSGKIFAEPTTWTGSIGVIIPRYDLSKLSEKVGVTSGSLTAGKFKDSLDPFRELTKDEKELWAAIIDDAYSRFVEVVADSRTGLTKDEVKVQLATGQIFTANQAVKNGLIDKIGYVEDVIESMKKELGLKEAKVITYGYKPGMLELLIGSVEAQQPENQYRSLMEATVPRAMYFCSSGPGIPIYRGFRFAQ
jgi:protease-4